MLLAINSLEVAFASAIAAGVAALASPWSSWAITKRQLKTEKVQRTYGDRRDAYKSILLDQYKGKLYLQRCAHQLRTDREKTAMELIKETNKGLGESIDDETGRLMLIGTFGPEQVVDAHQVFVNAWNTIADALSELERSRDEDAQLRETAANQ